MKIKELKEKYNLEELASNALKSLEDFEFAEFFFEEASEESITAENKSITAATSSLRRGVAIRVFNKGSIFHAYTTDLSKRGIDELVEFVKSMVRNYSTSKIGIELTSPAEEKFTHEAVISSPEIKVSKLREAIDKAFSYSYTQSFMGLVRESARSIFIKNSLGVTAEDDYVKTGSFVKIIATKDGYTDFSYKTRAFSKPASELDLVELVEDAIRIAEVNFSARPTPAGNFPIVVAHGQGAIVFHEACGHALEGDSIANETSVFSKKLGEKIAVENLNLIDDGTVPLSYGSYNFDDEGIPSQKTPLIENGILVGYMLDLKSSLQLGMKPTGNGRRQTYKHFPIPRMRNTIITPTKPDGSAEDIIASVKKGIYVKYLGGGQVDVITGDFVFSMREAYMIENGKITHPIRGGTIAGNGPEVLKSIVAFGDDFEMDSGGGMCGKEGQGAPVSQGQPTIKIAKLLVGGVG